LKAQQMNGKLLLIGAAAAALTAALAGCEK